MNHPNRFVNVPHGGCEPEGTLGIGEGGDDEITDTPPTTASANRIPPRMYPNALFLEYIYGASVNDDSTLWDGN